jgi:metal-sulfur cluster biosynthetic enzyme
MEQSKLSIEHVKTVIDPELGINIVDLGLVYGIYEKDGRYIIEMTLTTPGCPLAPYFIEQVPLALETNAQLPEGSASVQFTFDPPWTHEMMSEAARLQLALH